MGAKLKHGNFDCYGELAARIVSNAARDARNMQAVDDEAQRRHERRMRAMRALGDMETRIDWFLIAMACLFGGLIVGGVGLAIVARVSGGG